MRLKQFLHRQEILNCGLIEPIAWSLATSLGVALVTISNLMTLLTREPNQEQQCLSKYMASTVNASFKGFKSIFQVHVHHSLMCLFFIS